MSSKFSSSTLAPKPPGVCRYSPPPPPDEGLPFDETPFQGYVIYYAPPLTPHGYLAGSVLLPVSGPPPTWHGILVGGVFQIVIDAEYHASDQTFSYDIVYCAYGGPIDSRHASHRRPRSLDPFDSGEITFYPPPLGGRVAAHLWW